jgi:hypothetical protein
VNSIRPIIEALEGAHAHLNGTLFGGRLKTSPVITVQTKGRKKALGWYWSGRWVNGSGHPAELNMSAEDLKRPYSEVLETLVHEMCHQAADESGVKDTSRSGAYHNKKFRALAEGAGLCVPAEPDKRHGFAFTTLGPEGSRARLAVESIRSTIEPVLVLARLLPVGKKSKGKMLLFMCSCGFKIRCGRSELDARCNACDSDFVLQGADQDQDEN